MVLHFFVKEASVYVRMNINQQRSIDAPARVSLTEASIANYDIIAVTKSVYHERTYFIFV